MAGGLVSTRGGSLPGHDERATMTTRLGDVADAAMRAPQPTPGAGEREMAQVRNRAPHRAGSVTRRLRRRRSRPAAGGGRGGAAPKGRQPVAPRDDEVALARGQ